MWHKQQQMRREPVLGASAGCGGSGTPLGHRSCEGVDFSSERPGGLGGSSGSRALVPGHNLAVPSGCALITD